MVSYSCSVHLRKIIYFSVLLAALHPSLVWGASQPSLLDTFRQRLNGDLIHAVAQEDKRAAADRTFMEAEQLRKQGTAESLRKSIGKYQEAVVVYRSLGERKKQAEALSDIGVAYESLSEYRKASEVYNEALSLFRVVNERGREADTLNNLGSAYIYLGEYKKALDYLNQALPLKRATSERGAEADILNNFGSAYSYLGEYQEGLSFYNQVLPIYRAAGNRQGEADTLNSISGIYDVLGDKQEALDYLKQALPLAQAIGDRGLEARTLTNVGRIYFLLGENQKALDFLNQALPLKRVVGDRRGEAYALSTIAIVYYRVGEYPKALEIYNQALPLHRAAGDRRAETSALNGLGLVHSALGDKQKALDYFNQALVLARTLGDRSVEPPTLTNIGRTYHLLGDTQKALEYFNQALPLSRAIRDRNGEALTLYDLALVERDRGNLTEAHSQAEVAINIVESLRKKVSNQELRTSYFASVRDYYGLDIDLLMRLHNQRPSGGFAAAALQVSERARARALVDILSEAGANIREGVDLDLLKHERSLQKSLNTQASSQMRLLIGKHSEEQAAAMAKEIEALTSEYEEVEGKIRTTSPRYAALTQPQPLELNTIQKDLLDADTLLLEYALGAEQSYLWIVSTNSIKSYELGKRAEIEAAARRFFELVKANSKDEDVSRGATTLSDLLLTPARAELGSKRLLIVADGALQYVPFAALPVPSSVVSGQWSVVSSIATRDGNASITNPRVAASPRRPVASVPLIVDHEIVSLPSASTLAVLRRETAGRKPAAKAVAVLADPVFAKDDPRVTKGSNGAGESTQRSGPTVEIRKESEAKTNEAAIEKTDLLRSAEESGVGAAAGFGRLIGTRREAAAILGLVSREQRKESLDFDADKATATSSELGQYRIVHFATHGLLNSIHPELSGVVLSLVNRRGEAQDGFLRLNEIYSLKLPVELVVLSACQTGLGKEVRGEGLIGLTRGFMYAGSLRVMASLWKVDDKATSELMKSFYQGMLSSRHLSPAAALRDAQIAMWKQKRWRSAYYWAAFSMQGEWK